MISSQRILIAKQLEPDAAPFRRPSLAPHTTAKQGGDGMLGALAVTTYFAVILWGIWWPNLLLLLVLVPVVFIFIAIVVVHDSRRSGGVSQGCTVSPVDRGSPERDLPPSAIRRIESPREAAMTSREDGN